MNRRGHKGRVDANQAEIVRLLRAANFSVQALSMVGDGCPDLLVGACGKDYKVEVKKPGGKLTPDEARWQGEWRGAATLVLSTPDDTLTFIRTAMLEGRNL